MSRKSNRKPPSKRISIKRLAKFREDIRQTAAMLQAIEKLGIKDDSYTADRLWSTYQNIQWLLNNNKNSFYVVF